MNDYPDNKIQPGCAININTSYQGNCNSVSTNIPVVTANQKTTKIVLGEDYSSRADNSTRTFILLKPATAAGK
ncbi:MAG: hypothetical protein JW745_02480 [Sedimentisphaerales bacterium]|nr:hypothetical protein [Sedimentisphaerales bacterium]MBN2842108.1 hypothetical protein [Sedimentisphaerales bacterium]